MSLHVCARLHNLPINSAAMQGLQISEWLPPIQSALTADFHIQASNDSHAKSSKRSVYSEDPSIGIYLIVLSRCFHSKLSKCVGADLSWMQTLCFVSPIKVCDLIAGEIRETNANATGRRHLWKALVEGAVCGLYSSLACTRRKNIGESNRNCTLLYITWLQYVSLCVCFIETFCFNNVEFSSQVPRQRYARLKKAYRLSSLFAELGSVSWEDQLQHASGLLLHDANVFLSFGAWHKRCRCLVISCELISTSGSSNVTSSMFVGPLLLLVLLMDGTPHPAEESSIALQMPTSSCQ